MNHAWINKTIVKDRGKAKRWKNAGMVCIMLGGGFIELKTVLENGISAEEEKAKAISKERKNKYAK